MSFQLTLNHVYCFLIIGVTGCMMVVMLVMGIFTIHVPRFVHSGNEWWMEVVASAFFAIVSICVVMIVRKPRHRASSRNSIPCVPLMPICAIWIHIHLVVCLPYTSWLAFLIWSLLGKQPANSRHTHFIPVTHNQR